MHVVRLLPEFVDGLDFAVVKSVQLEDQGPPVRGRLSNINEPLVLVSGELAEGSEVVGKFSHENENVKKLLDVMREAKEADAAWMCPPVYRDALLFLNEEEEVVKALNICFSCHHLMDSTGDSYSCDEASFAMLGELLKSFGHLVHREE